MTNISNLDERLALAQPWKDRWTGLQWAIDDLYATIQHVTELSEIGIDRTTADYLKSAIGAITDGDIHTHKDMLTKLLDKAATLNTVLYGRAPQPNKTFQNEQFQLIEKLQELIYDYAKNVYDALEHNLIITDVIQPQKYSTNFALNFYFEQIATDLTILQQAFVQRFLLTNHVGWTEYILYLGDQLANHALKPAEEHHFISKSGAVICHLDKQLNIRLIPYANVVFIGLPSNLLPTEFEMTFKMSTDFLAIAHEIGHFVYWQGVEGDGGVPLFEQVPQKIKALPSINENDWRLRWIEELFADVYACLVAGPVMALEFQRLLLDNLPEHFKVDRDKHPIDKLRPYILNNILRQIQTSNGTLLYPNAPSALDLTWEQSTSQSAKSEHFTIKGIDQTISGEEIITSLTPIIIELLNILKPLWPKSADDSWSKDLDENSAVESLYEQFKSRQFDVLMSDYNHDNDFDPHNHESKIFIANRNLNNTHNRDSDEYLESVLFRGWSVEGPEGGNIGKG